MTKTVTLGEICRPKQWPTISGEQMTEEGYAVYGANGKVGFYHKFTHEYPTLLITCRGATCGSLNICEPFSYVNGNAMALDKLSFDFDMKFLYYYFQKRGFNDVISGSAQPQITGQGLTKVKITAPPLPRQRQIAALLDRADALRQKDRQLLTHYDQLAQSTFMAMFGDPVQNEKGWEKLPFGSIGDSRLGKMLDAKQQTGKSTCQYLGNSNVQWGRFRLSNLHEMDFSEKDKREFSLQFGDLLICEGGEVGRTAIWREELSDCYFQKALHRVRLDKSKATPEYVQYLMLMFSQKEGFKDFVTVATIAHLTGIKLKSMPIPVPPLALQQQFANIIERIERQKAVVRQQMAQSETLFQRLLQDCFGA